MNQNLINLMLALVLNHFLQIISDIMSVRQKVARLDAYISNRPWKEMKFNINTRLKSYSISVAWLVLVLLPLYGLFSWLDLSVDSALSLSAIILFLTYYVTFIGFDGYHVEIERITRKFKK